MRQFIMMFMLLNVHFYYTWVYFTIVANEKKAAS